MVPQLGDVVEDAVLRDSRGVVGALDDLFEGFTLPFGAFNRLVAIGDIGVVVLVMVILQRFRAHPLGGKGIVGIRKIGK